MSPSTFTTADIRRCFKRRTQPEEVSRVGPYRIKAIVNSGSYGTVALAVHDEHPNITVALKLLKESEDERNWADEGVITRYVTHPNIATVYTEGEADGFRYLAMEWIEGDPLRFRLTPGRPMPQRVAADLVQRLADAVAVMHERGFAHLDLKPDNVMVPGGKNSPRMREIKIVDFGLASVRFRRAIPDEGTAAYSPPLTEESVRDRVDVAPWDVYALGTLLHECLTGITPKERKRADHHEIADPDLAAICEKCLVLDRSQRFTARELSDDLLAYLGHWEIKARPRNWVQRTGRSLRRNWKSVSVVSLVILLSMALVHSIYQRKIDEADRQAEELRQERNRDHLIRKSQYKERLKWAGHYLDLNLVNDALLELDRAGDTGFRDEEWDRLKQRCNGSTWSIRFKTAIQALAFSTDGKELAIALAGEIHVVPFNLSELAARSDAFVKKWDVTPFREDSPGRKISQMVVTPDWLVTASTSELGAVACGIVDFHSREKKPRAVFRDNFLLEEDERTTSATSRLAVHPDGRTLVVPASQHRLRIIDITDAEKEELFPNEDLSYETIGLTFLDDNTFATIHRNEKGDGELRIWDWQNPPKGTKFEKINDMVGIACGPRADEFMVFSKEKIHFWKREAGQWKETHRQSAKSSGLVAWHPKKANLIAYALDNNQGGLVVLHLDKLRGHPHPLNGHRVQVTALAFDSSGDWLVSGDHLGIVHVWRVTDFHKKQ